MKKIYLCAVVCLLSSTAFTQKAKVQSAYNYLKYGELDKAKEAIDLASENEVSSLMGKTWLYRGKIYSAIANTKEEKYKALDSDALNKAYEAFSKAMSLNDKKVNKTDLNNGMAQLINPIFNQGIALFKEKKYEQAASKFSMTSKINDQLGLLDTLSIYNTGLAYANASKYDMALERYKKCLETGYGKDKMYTTVADLMVKNNNKQGAIDLIQNEGLKKYPTSQSLINYQFSLYLQDEDYDGALKSVDASIANDPTNAVFHYNKGFILDQKGDRGAAVQSYEKAIDVDAEYFDAYYNLGAIYFNDGASKIKQRNELPLNAAAKAKELKESSVADFNKALPFLEKAHNINPNDKSTLQSLREIYSRIGNTEKYKLINDKLTN